MDKAPDAMQDSRKVEAAYLQRGPFTGESMAAARQPRAAGTTMPTRRSKGVSIGAADQPAATATRRARAEPVRASTEPSASTPAAPSGRGRVAPAKPVRAKPARGVAEKVPALNTNFSWNYFCYIERCK